MRAPECCGTIPFGHLNICGENGNPPHSVWIFSTTIRKIPQYIFIIRKRK